MTAPTCCGPVEPRTGADVYPHRADLAHLRFFVCTRCAARVGCHRETGKPLGTLAGPELRRARRILHDRRFDPLWQSHPGGENPRPPAHRRSMAYGFLAARLGIERSECHTGMFDLARCRAAWRALRDVTWNDVEVWHAEKKAAEAREEEPAHA